MAFGKYLLESLESYLGSNLILAGDLNTDLDDFLGKCDVSKGVPNYKLYLQKLVGDLDLVDIWHLKHPQTKSSLDVKKQDMGWHNLGLISS